MHAATACFTSTAFAFGWLPPQPGRFLNQLWEMNMSHKTTFRFGVAVFAALLASNSLGAVEIYGRANLALESLDNGEDSGLNVSSNSSRIGFRNETLIVEGLKGFFQLEQEIRFDNGSGTFATRDTFAGLQGKFGSVRLGFFDTPLKKIRSETDFFNDQIGDARNLTRLNQSNIVPAGLGGTAVNADFDVRFFNGIIYTTPSFGGFTVDFHHSTNNNGTTTNPADDQSTANSIGLSYKAGDLYLSLANESDDGRNDSGAVRFGARYTLGNLTLAVLAQKATLKPGVYVAGAPGAPLVIEPAPGAAGEEIDIDTIGFGASFKLMDNVVLKGQLYKLTDDRDDRDAQLIAIGVDHSLSKQFRLVYAYAKTSNDDLANYRATGGGHGDQITPSLSTDVPPAFQDPSGVSAGIRYDFN
jgi:predicted porin